MWGASGNRSARLYRRVHSNRSLGDPAIREIAFMHFEIETGEITRVDELALDTYTWEVLYSLFA
jgi:hypothetical protein